MFSEQQDSYCCQQQHDIPAEQQHQKEQHHPMTAEEDTLHWSALSPTMEVSCSSSSSCSRSTTRKSSRGMTSAMNFMVVVLMQMMLLSSFSKQSVVDASRDKTLSANEMAKYWIDAGDVLEQLDDYQALWIKVHGCVWSECASSFVYDDDGEGRDGDEQWYLSRTQEFCANAAFSLYGIPKNHISLLSCTRGNFINSFFTYGGADNLLEALGRQPNVYYDGEYVDGYYNANYYSGNSTNSECVYNGDTGLSSTMGCAAKGQFAMATFEGDYCHGGDFYDVIDPLRKYNRQMRRVGCHKIWGRNGFGNHDQMATLLLKNSWSCDLDLYPNGCPDPYGKKARYDYALRAVAHGQSPKWAIANMKWKRPLRVLSWLMIAGGVFLLIFGYNVKNRDRMAANGGGLRGFFRVVSEDIHAYRKELARKRREAKVAAKERRAERAEERRRRKKDKKEKKKRRKSKGRSSRRRSDEVDVELSQSISPTKYGEMA
mmetsp:Transcript_32286/g.78771  ORF Transcript_32286/g.78771 Transcript_32286/m.78771 type:complete len:486 (-) Transcript_32286:3450-4907(-)